MLSSYKEIFKCNTLYWRITLPSRRSQKLHYRLMILSKFKPIFLGLVVNIRTIEEKKMITQLGHLVLHRIICCPNY